MFYFSEQETDTALRAAGFEKPTYKTTINLTNEYRVGRHDLIVTVEYDYDYAVVEATCEEWGFEADGQFHNAADILAWIEAQKEAVETLIDAD